MLLPRSFRNLRQSRAIACANEIKNWRKKTASAILPPNSFYNVFIRAPRSFRAAVNNPSASLPRSIFAHMCVYKSFPNPSADFWKSQTHTKSYFCITKCKKCMRHSENTTSSIHVDDIMGSSINIIYMRSPSPKYVPRCSRITLGGISS